METGLSHTKVTHDSGFTLVEVLVAVAIITIGFFGIYSLHIQSIAANSTIRFHLKAPMLAQQKMSEFDTALSDVSEASGEFDGDFAGFSWKTTPKEIESETLGSASEKLVSYDLEIFDDSSSYMINVYRYSEQTTK